MKIWSKLIVPIHWGYIIEYRWNNCWNRTKFSMVTERIEQVIVRINTWCNKSKAVLPYWWEFEQLLGLIADQAMPLIWLTFFLCTFETMIIVWILTLIKSKFKLLSLFHDMKMMQEVTSCIIFISYELVAFWALYIIQ